MMDGLLPFPGLFEGLAQPLVSFGKFWLNTQCLLVVVDRLFEMALLGKGCSKEKMGLIRMLKGSALTP